MDGKLFTQHQTGGMFAIQDMAVTTGSFFFVDSTHALAEDADGFGLNPDAPFATLAYAFSSNVCTANKGDIIYVAPGHVETIAAAAGIAMDIAGVSVIGLGNGTNQPTITLGTSTSADVDVDAANITISGIRFVSAINSLKNILDCNAANLLVEDCHFSSSSALEVVVFVDLATGIDNFTFRRCSFIQPTDPEGTDGNAATGCFYFVDSENIFIEDCFFDGQFETAIFHNKTTAAKNMWVRNCYGIQLLTAAEVWLQVANMSGGCMGSLLITRGAADNTEATITGTLSDNFFVGIDSGFGNDGGGGQLAIPVAGAAT